MVPQEHIRVVADLAQVSHDQKGESTLAVVIKVAPEVIWSILILLFFQLSHDKLRVVASTACRALEEALGVLQVRHVQLHLLLCEPTPDHKFVPRRYV